jgi:hypothetical protein
MGSVRAVLDLQAKAILDQATRRLIQERYDQPVMSNLVRPDHVEFLISVALGGDWPLVSSTLAVFATGCLPGWGRSERR